MKLLPKYKPQMTQADLREIYATANEEFRKGMDQAGHFIFESLCELASIDYTTDIPSIIEAAREQGRREAKLQHSRDAKLFTPVSYQVLMKELREQTAMTIFLMIAFGIVIVALCAGLHKF